VYESDDFLTITPLDMPAMINEKNVFFDLRHMISASELIVCLTQVTGYGKTEEFGVLDFTTGQYISVWLLTSEQDVQVRAANQDYIVFDRTEDDWLTHTLLALAIKTRELQEIHQFKQSYPDNMSGANMVKLLEDVVYYGDISFKGATQSMDIFTFDLSSGSTGLILENAQNPMILNGSVVAIAKSNTGEFDTLVRLDGSPLAALSGLTSINAGPSVFAAINKEPEKKIPAYALCDLLGERELLTTHEVMSDIQVSDSFVTWTTWRNERPFLYLVKEQCFVRLAGILGKTTYFYAVYDDVGLVQSANSQTPGKPRWYKFELQTRSAGT
jgi:hypothetical protein